MSGLYATRAAQVNATFVKLADTLVSDFDVVDLLDRLVRTCVDVLQAKAAGLLLLDKGGHLRVMASSNEDMRLLELLELLNDDGPSVACFRTGAAVSVSNLSVLAEEWPTFVPAALTAGFRFRPCAAASATRRHDRSFESAYRARRWAHRCGTVHGTSTRRRRHHRDLATARGAARGVAGRTVAISPE
jgi:hypothetical protein